MRLFHDHKRAVEMSVTLVAVVVIVLIVLVVLIFIIGKSGKTLAGGTSCEAQGGQCLAKQEGQPPPDCGLGKRPTLFSCKTQENKEGVCCVNE
ncbi:hypothetical protein HZB03_01490 [Candidatus Woesearchaeota archaeon]|nr:hypothetical protein [Candidatus Woesearchaeota archaeon]